jgi:hypothetical protein
VQKEAGERNESPRVRGGAYRSTGFDAPRTAHDHPSEMDDSQRLGLDVAQVGEGFCGPGLRCILIIPHGLERAVFDSLGRNRIRILRLKFSVFLGKQND